MVCYYENWAQYRPGVQAMRPKDIDPYLCTHIVYAFARVVDNELLTYEWNDFGKQISYTRNTTYSKLALVLLKLLSSAVCINYGLIFMTELYAEAVALKKRNPELKVILAVGGWTHGTANFTKMVGGTILTPIPSL